MNIPKTLKLWCPYVKKKFPGMRNDQLDTEKWEQVDRKKGDRMPRSGHGIGLDVGEIERLEKVFNLGDHNVDVTTREVVIRGKTNEEWGEDLVLDRSQLKASISTESKTPLQVFHIAYVAYALGFLLLFVVDGVSARTQIAVFGIALTLLLFPLLLRLLLPTMAFLLASGVFYVVVFSLPETVYLATIYRSIEGLVGEGSIEAFIMGAAILPILLRYIISHTIVDYRIRLGDESASFVTVASGPSAPSLVEYLEKGRLPRHTFRLPSPFLVLSRERMKGCQYCAEKTFSECARCHVPICETHIHRLRGHNICPGCYVQTRGKLKKDLR